MKESKVEHVAESKVDAQRTSRSSNFHILYNTALADLFKQNILWRRNYETNGNHRYLIDYI